MKLKTIISIVLLFSLNTLLSQTYIQAYADVVNQTSQTIITNNLTTFESLGVKRRGTPALQNTLDWLKSKYLSFGYTQSQLTEDSFQNASATCKNLIVTKTGTVYPNIYVIICGHYDSIVGTGTNDNGSGTTSILEVARLLQNIPTEYSIKFINFSGEEDGLIGSQHYVSSVVNGTSPKMNIRVVLNLDQVGGVAGEVNNTITCERDLGSPTSNNAASDTKTNELKTCVELYTPLNTIIAEAYASDYIPFENNNEVITGLYETNESSHPHSASDLFVNMDPTYVYNVAKAATAAMMHYAIASTTILNANDYNENFQVAFFPNPTKEFLYIDFGQLANENYLVQIIDLNGKIIYENKLENSTSVSKINVTTFPKGIYLVRLHTNEKVINKKIIIN